MKRLLLFAALALPLGGVNVLTVEAGTILSESFTGAQLYGDSRVSFPSRTPELQGSSLFFNIGSTRLDKLLVLQLFPQNALDPADPVIVHISANFTAQTSAWPTDPTDHDPGIGVGDGAFFGGVIAADNYNGEADAVIYSDSGSVGQPFAYSELFTGAGYPVSGQALTVESTITLTTTATTIQGAFGSKSGSHSFASALDLNAPFNLVVFAHDAQERYKLNWLSVEVQGTPAAVPEPTSLVLWSGLGVMGLVAARRRKRAA